jgi:hypothetical protein
LKTTVKCGRCEADVDIEEGCLIAVCLTPMSNKKTNRSHQIEVDPNHPAGKKIIDHFERRGRLN